ncbi:MAG: hypothetical protein ACI8RD_003550, partial [Bacillariaceae sp.]
NNSNSNSNSSGIFKSRQTSRNNSNRRGSDIYRNGNKGTISKGIRISRCILNDNDNYDDDDDKKKVGEQTSFVDNYHDHDNGNDGIAHEARVFAAAMINESERRQNSSRNLLNNNNSSSSISRSNTIDRRQELSSSSSASSSLRKMMNRASPFRSSTRNVNNNFVVENDNIDIEKKKKKFQFNNDELDTIYLVDDTTNNDITDDNDSSSSNKYLGFLRRKMICRIGICLIVAIFVVTSFVVVAAMSRQQNQKQSSSSSSSIRGGGSTSSNTSTAVKISNDERLESIIQFLSSGTTSEISSTKDLYDSTSPQYRAAKWLADDDSERLVVPTSSTTTTSPFNFVQRYVLAVLYFALGGGGGGDSNNGSSSSWINDYHFVSNDQHECSWFETVLVDNSNNNNNKINDGGGDDIDAEEDKEDGGSIQSQQYYAMGVTCDRDLQVRSISLRKLLTKIFGLLTCNAATYTNNSLVYLFFVHSHHYIALHYSFLVMFLFDHSLFDVYNINYKASNNLKGSIPREIQYLSKLDYLDLSQNSIDGTIPHRELFSQNYLVQLEYLNLKDNQLTGPILPPYSWMLGNSLRFLDLSNNNLHLLQDVKSIEKDNISGVSESWHNSAHLGATTLETLIIGGNNNNNPVDDEKNEDITTATATTFVIPEQIRLLTNLRELSLNNLTLHGTIPSWIGSELRHLKSLLLHDNNFVGTVPESVGSLPNLGKCSTRC